MKVRSQRASPLRNIKENRGKLPSLPTPVLSPSDTPRESSLTKMSNYELKNHLRMLKNQESLSAQDMIPPWLLDRSDFVDTCREFDSIPHMRVVDIISKDSQTRSDVEKIALAKWFNKQYFIRGLSDRLKRRIGDKLAVACIPRGESLAKGEEVGRISILVSGLVRRGDTVIGPPNILDDVDLSLNQNRQEEIVPITDVECLQMKKEDYKEYLYAGRREKIRNLCDVLSAMDRISLWPNAKVQTMAMNSHLFQYNKGEVIYEFGSAADSFT